MTATWDDLYGACRSCKMCPLCRTRTNVVVGVGNRNADIMFVGEGPGYYEDQAGEPFVGAAGKLLDKMLAAIELTRDMVYITNVVKCRPPNNRDPLPQERDACINYLRFQVLLVRPKIIVCLGRIAAKTIISEDFRITAERGNWFERKGYQITATYHPSALLRDGAKKRPAWEDLKSIKNRLDSLHQEK